MLIWCSLQMDVMRGPCTPARSAGMGLWALGSIAGTVIQMLTWAKFLPGSIDAEVGQSRQCDPEQRPQWTLRILTLLRPSVHQMFVSNKWQFFITALLPPSPWRIFFFLSLSDVGWWYRWVVENLLPHMRPWVPAQVWQKWTNRSYPVFFN